MAQSRVLLEKGKLSCLLCSELFEEPVSLACGHSFCLSCIKTRWDGVRTFSCPQCKKRLKRRPVLSKNVTLAELVEKLKMDEAAAEASAAGDGDVSCDSCNEKKLKAVMSCLDCPASFCEEHVKPHKESPAFKHHELIGPSENLQENICPLHDKVMKIFCRTDQLCICYLCLMEQHKGHETVPAAAERAEKQKKLEVTREQIDLMVHYEEDQEMTLQKAADNYNDSVNKVVRHNQKFFMKKIRLLHKESSEKTQQIRSRQQTEVGGVNELQEKLQDTIRELKRKQADMRQLSSTEDHNKFLREFPSASEIMRSVRSMDGPRLSEEVRAAVVRLRALTVQTEEHRDPDPETGPAETPLDPEPALSPLQLSESAAALMEQQNFSLQLDGFT